MDMHKLVTVAHSGWLGGSADLYQRRGRGMVERCQREWASNTHHRGGKSSNCRRGGGGGGRGVTA